MERRTENGGLWYNVAVTASQLAGILVIVLVAIWMSQYRGGQWTFQKEFSLDFDIRSAVRSLIPPRLFSQGLHGALIPAWNLTTIRF